MNGINRGAYQKRYLPRKEPIRHWSENADSSEVLEDKTNFVFRNGRWIHEPKIAAHVSATRSVSGLSYATKCTSENNKTDAKSSPRNQHSTVTKSSSYDSTYLKSVSEKQKPNKVLDFAKKKWNNLTDLVKDHKKPSPFMIKRPQPTPIPELPPKRNKSTEEVVPKRRPYSPLFGQPNVPSRSAKPQPGVPSRDKFPSTSSLTQTSENLMYENEKPYKPGPSRPSRPRHEKSKNKQLNGSDIQQTPSLTPENQRSQQRHSTSSFELLVDASKKQTPQTGYVKDALYKFDKLLETFQKGNCNKVNNAYTTEPIPEYKNMNSNKNFAFKNTTTKFGSSDAVSKTKPPTESKPVSHKVAPYRSKISEENKGESFINNNFSKKADYLNIAARQDNTFSELNNNTQDDRFDKLKSIKFTPRANKSDYVGYYDVPRSANVNEVTRLNKRNIGSYPSNEQDNNISKVVDTTNSNILNLERNNTGDVYYNQETADKYDNVNVKRNRNMADDSHANGRDIELYIHEDGDENTKPSTEFINVRRHSGYKTRKIRSIGPNGEYKEETESAATKSESRQVARTKENGLLEIVRERQAVAKHTNQSFVGDSRGISHSSANQLDRAARERDKYVTDGINTSRSVQQKAAEQFVQQSAVMSGDSLQVTRTVTGAQAVIQRHSANSRDSGAVLDKAVIKIPNAGYNKSKASVQSLSSPGSDSSTGSSSNLGSRYRIVNNSSFTSQSTQHTQEVNLSVENSVTETDRAVLIAAIDARIREKESHLFNPTAVSENTKSSLNKLRSKEEEEALARERILAQARQRMGGRQTLKRRSLIVDEEMLETLFLRCIICQDRYDTLERIPKLLPCHHTYCLHCLKEMFRVEAEHRQSLTSAFQELPTFVSINCPTCRDNHMINDSNCSELKSDQKVLELLEISEIPVCDVVGFCTKHKTQKLDYFCETCEYAICNDCRVLDHSEQTNHVVYNRDDALSAYADDVTSSCASAEEQDRVLSEIEGKLQGTIEGVEKRLTETVEHIKDVFDKFRFSINNRQDLLMEKLRREINKKTDDYSADLEAITQKLDSLVQTRALLIQAKEDEDIEQMFVSQKKANDLQSPLDLVSKPNYRLKANYIYDKRNRANIMSTISDHGLLTS